MLPPVFLDAEQLESLLDFPSLMEAIQRAFLDGVSAPPRDHHQPDSGSFLVMPAWAADAVGIKLVTIRPDNRRVGRPTIQGLYVLFHAGTGEPLAVMDGRMLTLLRTAATSALAAGLLARPDASHHVMVGAGALAPYLIRAMGSVRSISRVSIWNRTASRARELAVRLSQSHVKVVAVDDLEEAVATADIISTATQSTQALILGRQLPAAVHLDLVGAYTPEMVEADPDALDGARIFVDTWDGARSEAGDLIQAVAAGTLAWSDVAGDLRALLSGDATGRIDAETTVFKSVGASLEDLAAAKLAWQTHSA